jgi:hypothetical protein
MQPAGYRSNPIQCRQLSSDHGHPSVCFRLIKIDERLGERLRHGWHTAFHCSIRWRLKMARKSRDGGAIVSDSLRSSRTISLTQRTTMKNNSLLLCAIFIISTGQLMAQTSGWITKNGIIRHITNSAGNNYAFRIFLSDFSGIDQLSSCSGGFAFINASDDNYQTKVATLLSAQSQQKYITINYTTNAEGFCQITDITI